MGVTTDGGSVAAFIAEAVSEHVEATEERLAGDLRDAAKRARAQIKRASPKSSGGYASGWSMRSEARDGHVEVVVFNKRKPGLTHLLEKGHASGGGGRTPGRPHISPAYEAARDELVRKTGAR